MLCDGCGVDCPVKPGNDNCEAGNDNCELGNDNCEVDNDLVCAGD